MHDGNYIAGGTSSGQVVLWDITGRIEAVEKTEELTTGQQKYCKIMVSLYRLMNSKVVHTKTVVTDLNLCCSLSFHCVSFGLLILHVCIVLLDGICIKTYTKFKLLMYTVQVRL